MFAWADDRESNLGVEQHVKEPMYKLRPRNPTKPMEPQRFAGIKESNLSNVQHGEQRTDPTHEKPLMISAVVLAACAVILTLVNLIMNETSAADNTLANTDTSKRTDLRTLHYIAAAFAVITLILIISLFARRASRM
jgi:hypothetical protein